jgi:phosphonate transport system ATP-binding protein
MSVDGVIAVHAASKTFGARRALDAVSLNVGRGEMIGLIGPSGAGKSTLLRAINGLVVLDTGEGTVEAFGASVQHGGRVSERVRQVRARIGMVFQQFNLVGRLSLYNNVALGMLGRINVWRGIFGLWPAAEKTAVMAALARVGIADQAGQRAGTLSGGQQQRAAIARGLAMRPKVMLFDEPTSALDPELVGEVLRVMRGLAEEGRTMLVVTHEMDFARDVSSRVMFLHQGLVEAEGPPAELFAGAKSERFARFIAKDGR